jgi:hypothetical protein
LRGTPVFRPVLAVLKTTDRILFKLVPFMRKYAWHVVITLSQPK